MNINLAENIRRFRKARGLTQQQLADALGVTVGAVYKWEADLSSPDLSLLVELADLFDTSVDVLLGYGIKCNKQADTAARLKAHLHNREKEGLREADKALIRYPNSFDVVYGSAMLYYNFGFISRDRALLGRAVELLERAVLLLGQNTDPQISELTIRIDMAAAWAGMGDDERMVEILKKDNPRGINDDMIGLSLAGALNRPDEALSHLSSALVRNLASLIRIVMGYENVFLKRHDYVSGRDLLRLALAFFDGFRVPGRSNLLDKPCAALFVVLAYAELQTGAQERAREALRRAKALAAAFDLSPAYSAEGLRFVLGGKEHTAFDDLGETAWDGVLELVKDMDSEELSELWEEVTHEE